MALFGIGKKEIKKKSDTKSIKSKSVAKTPKKEVVKAEKVATTSVAVAGKPFNAKSMGSIILRPRITEKSGSLSVSNVYTFEIAKNANKNTVRDAIHSLYKVNPIKVTIINGKEKGIIHRGKRGYVSSIKKAMVTLKVGDKIEFV